MAEAKQQGLQREPHAMRAETPNPEIPNRKALRGIVWVKVPPNPPRKGRQIRLGSVRR